MDKQVKQIMEEIEQALARDSRQEHWALIPVEQAQLPRPVGTCFERLAG